MQTRQLTLLMLLFDYNDGVQMGTRFMATYECAEKDSYKQAIV